MIMDVLKMTGSNNMTPVERYPDAGIDDVQYRRSLNPILTFQTPRNLNLLCIEYQRQAVFSGADDDNFCVLRACQLLRSFYSFPS